MDIRTIKGALLGIDKSLQFDDISTARLKLQNLISEIETVTRTY